MTESEEESKSMLKAQQATPSSGPEIDETSPALESQPQTPQNDKGGDSIQLRYMTANSCAFLRCLFGLFMLGGAARILALGPTPTVFPFAVFGVACASLHVLLVAHRVVRPRSFTSALPPRRYLLVLVASPLILLVAVVYGLTVIILTKNRYNERDLSRTTYNCGKSSSGPCHPRTRDADVFDMTIFSASFAFAMLLAGFKQCYQIYHLSRISYTEEEIDYAHKSASNISAGAILKQTIGGCWRRSRKT